MGQDGNGALSRGDCEAPRAPALHERTEGEEDHQVTLGVLLEIDAEQMHLHAIGMSESDAFAFLAGYVDAVRNVKGETKQ